ncbi:MAG: thiamine ABC transporter substrate binding subunit [Anaerolineae bacterium]
MATSIATTLAVAVVAQLALGGCSGASDGETGSSARRALVVASHSSFSVSEDVLQSFEKAHAVDIEYLDLGDAGEALNKVILSKDAPFADVFYGVDNTFLSRALESGVFESYESPLLAIVPDELELDPDHRLLPVDVGYVNINADREWFAREGIGFPQRLSDLTRPEYKGLLVVENPATSSPGLAFLLTTIAVFGEDGYLDYWAALRDNDVLAVDGWSEAYYEHFTVGSSGAGDRPLVVSYSTSPPADVLYAEDGRTEPGSFNISPPGETFRQIEFVGVLAGTENRELAREFVDFTLGEAFQNDLPLQMFVYPVSTEAELPPLFEQYAEVPAEPAQIDPQLIERHREEWITAWTDTVLR